MTFIWQKNKENLAVVAWTTSGKFFAVILPNKPWPCGLRQIASLATLNRAYVEWLRPARFALRINAICQQRNTLESTNGA